MQRVIAKVWGSMTLVAYGIGNAYENWERTRLDRYFSFEYLADKKYSERRNRTDAKKIGPVDLANFVNTVIVVFPRDVRIFNEIKAEYENRVKNVTVYSAEEFFDIILEHLGRALVNDFINGEAYSEEDYYFVARYHIGDIVNLFPSISAFKMLHNNPSLMGLDEGRDYFKDRRVRKVTVLTYERMSGLCMMCDDVDSIEVFSEYELEAINHHLSNRKVHNMYPDGNMAIWARNAVFGGTMTWYPYRLYDLPIKNEKVKKYILDYRINMSDELKKRAHEFIAHNDISISNTVFLCPYSQTTSLLDDEIWQEIIENLRNSGIRALTNVGPREDALRGTEKLAVDVPLFLALVSLGIKVVGVQSGLIDAVGRLCVESDRNLVLWNIKNDYEALFAYDMGVLCEKGSYSVKKCKSLTYITFDYSLSLDIRRRIAIDHVKAIIETK